MKLLNLALLILLISIDCIAATGDVVIDTRSSRGLRVANNLIPVANHVIGFDALGRLVVKEGSGAVGGANTQVLFNDGGTIQGDAGLTYNKTDFLLTVNKLAFIPGANSGSFVGGAGGQLNLRGGVASSSGGDGANAGSINLSGGLGLGPGTAGVGGSITMNGSSYARGGNLLMSGGFADGGDITTSGGGGSINTTIGIIQLGVAGTRTTIQTTASSDVTINLPSASGTLLLANGVGTNLTNITASNLIGIVPAASLPTPGASTLGGVKSSTGTAGQFATGINTSGEVTYATPAGGGSYNSTVTSLTGSGTSLNAIATTSLTVGTPISILLSGELQDWVLTSSTSATTTGIQRPTDYNASTNAKVWIRRR